MAKKGLEGKAAQIAESKPLNRSLHAAKSPKQDQFDTQYVDIQKEVEAYLEFAADTFYGKIVYCNCDDPFEGNFFKYFAANSNKLWLRKLITTSYDGSPIAGTMTLSLGCIDMAAGYCQSAFHVKTEGGQRACRTR